MYLLTHGKHPPISVTKEIKHVWSRMSSYIYKRAVFSSVVFFPSLTHLSRFMHLLLFLFNNEKLEPALFPLNTKENITHKMVITDGYSKSNIFLSFCFKKIIFWLAVAGWIYLWVCWLRFCIQSSSVIYCTFYEN